MITLLYGPNGYLRSRALSAIASKSMREVVERFDGANMTERQLSEALQGMSLFSKEKLVIVRGLSANKPVWEKLADIASAIPDETHLVLVEDAPDKRTKTFKLLQKTTTTIACNELTEQELIHWLMTEVKTTGKDMSPRLASIMVARAGANQLALANELEKLLLSQQPLTNELIESMVEDSEEGNAFTLLDAVLNKQLKVVNSQLARLQQSEDPYRLFALLVSQIFSLAIVWAEHKTPPSELAKRSGLHPFVIKKLTVTASKLTRKQLEIIVEAVATLDDRLKSSAADPWELLKLTLAKIVAS